MTDRNERCSDIRDTCIVGASIRRGIDPALAVAEALDSRLFRGIRPSVVPLTRAQAIAELLGDHCELHRPVALALLAALSPGTGLPRHRPTPR